MSRPERKSKNAKKEAMEKEEAAEAERVDIAEHYANCEASGLQYGGAFQTVVEAWRGDGEILARLQLSPSAPTWQRDLLAMDPSDQGWLLGAHPKCTFWVFW